MVGSCGKSEVLNFADIIKTTAAELKKKKKSEVVLNILKDRYPEKRKLGLALLCNKIIK